MISKICVELDKLIFIPLIAQFFNGKVNEMRFLSNLCLKRETVDLLNIGKGRVIRFEMLYEFRFGH